MKNNREHLLSIDINDPTWLDVEGAVNGGLQKDQIQTLPVYGKIAAGQPIEMNPVVDETLYLPKSWIKNAGDFILKVQGDSMINAGINEGDYVLIRQQQTADNLDIVVVALEQDAVIKKFSRMGETVLLLSENPQYDPIMIDHGQVNILGKAVALIKQL